MFPTLKEAGVEGVEVQQWYGFFAPAKTPKAVIDQVNKALNEVLADPEVVKRSRSTARRSRPARRSSLGALVKSELVKWKSVVQRAKLVAE
jgi:tripartite-type tricarboxylate transporter receptor subunit TctC